MKKRIARLVDLLLSSHKASSIGELVWNREKRRLESRGFFYAKHIFIVGCGHSGTSLLISRLDNHPSVAAIPGETRFFQLDLFRRALLLRNWASEWQPQSVLAEKTPIHVRYCADIGLTFPRAITVAICRHPLDVVASLLRRSGGPLRNAIERWNKDNSFLLEGLHNKNIQHLVKYEDFVADPESVMRGVQEACDLEVLHGLSENADLKSNWYSTSAGGRSVSASEEGHNLRRQRQINQGIFDGRGTHKRVLSKSQVTRVLEQTRTVARQLGYGDAP